MAPTDGRIVADRYRLVERIADGGMSTVWVAWDERLHRRVALKQLRLQHGLSEADARLASDRAMREARITARLHHVNAVPVYDVVTDDGGGPCLVMQYLPSRSLQAVLAERGTLPADEVARLGRQIAAALVAAHAAGIVHRDVKPGNVLIDEDNNAKLTDFGISHALGDVTLTSTGLVTGTPAYLAPEAARGEPAGFPADVFALGATLYTALEGRPPVGDSDNPIAVLHKVASGNLDAPSPQSPLAPLLSHMLTYDPSARPEMADVERELARVAAVPSSATTVSHQAARGGAPAMLPPTTTMMLPAAGSRSRTADGVGAPPRRRPNVPPAVPPNAPPNRPPNRPPAPPNRAAAGRPPRRSRGPLLAASVVAALILLGGIVALLVATSGGSGEGTASGTQHSSSAPRTPASSPSSAPQHSSSQAPTSASHTSASSSARTSSSSAPSSSSRASSSNAAPPAGGNDLTQAITSYYALLPNDTNDAWPRLTANYQQNHAGGRAGFDQFWSGYRSVTTSNVHPIGSDSVEADLTYTKTDGTVVHEVDDYTLVREGGILKIDQSSVVG